MRVDVTCTNNYTQKVHTREKLIDASGPFWEKQCKDINTEYWQGGYYTCKISMINPSGNVVDNNTKYNLLRKAHFKLMGNGGTVYQSGTSLGTQTSDIEGYAYRTAMAKLNLKDIKPAEVTAVYKELRIILQELSNGK